MRKFLLTLAIILTFGLVKAETASITFSEVFSANSTALTGLELDDFITLDVDKGTGSTAPQYYTNGTALRWYAGNTMTITAASGYAITGITFTFGTGDGTNAITSDVGTFNSPTWTGSAQQVVFTEDGSSGHRRIAGISVTYVEGTPTGGGGTVTPEPDPTPGEGTSVTFNFKEDTYGAGPAYTNSNTAYVSSDNVATNENVRVTFGGDSSAWRFWSDGIRAYKNKNAYFTVEALSGNITAIDFTVASGATFAVDGTNQNVTSWTGSATSVRFNYTNTSDNKALVTLTVTVEGGQEITVVAPKVSCVDNMVSMSCETEGASIYYTIDGNEPSASSSLYSNPFPITANTVVKAIAIKGSDKSAITTYNAEYVGKYASFQDLVNAGANAEGTVEGPITAVYQNGQYLFVVDNTNYPMLVYGSISESLNNGDQIASVKGKYSPYNNLPEIANPVLGNITPGTPVQPQEVTTAITNDMINRYVVFNGATLTSADAMTYGDNLSAVLYKRFNDVEIPTDYDKKYNVTGFVSIFGANLQVYPVSFEEVSEPAEPAEFVSSNPENNSSFAMAEPQEVKFTVTYSAPVQIEAWDKTKVTAYQVSNATNAKTATEWTVTVPADYVKDVLYGFDPEAVNEGINPAIYAYIYAWEESMMDGEEVTEYVQVNGEDYLSLMYMIDYSGKCGAPIEIEIAENAIGHLNLFDVTAPDFDYLTLTTLEGITVTGNGINATATKFEKGVVTFSPWIYETGEYTLYIPYGAFTVGNNSASEDIQTLGRANEGDQMYQNQETTVNFNVTVTASDGAEQQEGGEADELPIDDATFSPVLNTPYAYTPTSNGVLALTIDGKPYALTIMPALLTQDGVDVPYASTNETDGGMFPTATEFTWNLESGKEYIFNLQASYDAEEIGTYLFTWAGESTPPTIVYEEMKFNQLYETPENGSVTLQFTPTVNGTLTVTQRGGNSLSYVYSDMPNLDDLEENLIEDPVVGGSQMVRELTYSLTANHTYYVYAKRYNNSLQSLEFEFTPEDSGEEPGGNVLVLDKATDISPWTTYTFTAPQSGILTINTQPYGSDLYYNNNQQFFFSSESLSNSSRVPLAGERFESEVLNGYAYNFDVEEGETYYVYVDSWDTYTFLLTMEDEPAGDVIVLDVETTVPAWNTYTFKAPKSGLLTVATNSYGTDLFYGNSQEFFYKDENRDNAVPMEEYIADSSLGGKGGTFMVDENVTYYVYNPAWDPITFLFTMNAGPVSEYLPLETGIEYTADGVGVLKLQVTPEADAILVATQMGSYDTHLWSEVPNTEEDGIYIENNLVGTIGGTYTGDESTGYVLEYDLKAGQTYYVYAKINAYDDLSSVTYAWKEIEEGLVINLNEMTTINMNEVYTFTAPETGILTVNVASFSVYGTEQYWVYSNAACTDMMPFVGKDDSSVLQGLALDFNVEKGKKYYFTNTDFDPLTFYLTLEEGETNPSRITSIEPTPGTAYDFVNYQNYWNLVTSPADASVESVELVYTDLTNTEKRVAVTDYFNPDGTLRISATALAAAKSDIMNGTYAVFELKGLMAGGKYVTVSDIENYVTVGENGDVNVSFMVESPITLVDKTFPNPLYTTYAEGDDDNEAVITFSGDVAEIGAVKVVAGRFVPGSIGGEAPTASVTIPTNNVTLSGNTITVDFTGVNLSSLPVGTVSFVIDYVKGENGLEASFEGNTNFVEYLTLAVRPQTPTELAGELTPQDITIKVVENEIINEAVLPIELTYTGEMEYMGFQFEITLPETLTIEKAELGEALTLNQYTKEVNYSLYNAENNTYMVVAALDKGYTAQGVVANLTLAKAEGATLVEGEYPAINIENAVVFSTTMGDDIKSILGGEGTITIEDATNYITNIEFVKEVLEKPSYTYPVNEHIDAVTRGEGLVMQIDVTYSEPYEDNKNVEEMIVEITIGDQTITGDDVWSYFDMDENGNWVFNTSAIEVETGESVEVTVTASGKDANASYTFTVRGVLLGDSNFNNEVTVADVVTTANYIVGLNSTRFDYPNANAIVDDEINVQDVTETVGIALAWDGPLNVRRRSNSVSTFVSNDMLSIDNFRVKNDAPFNVAVNLDNTNGYAAIQAEVIIPEGMKVAGVTAGPRAAEHNLVYNITDGKVIVVLYSGINASFANIEGALFNLEVVASEDCGNIEIANILAADSRSNGYVLGYEGGENATGTTGINGIDADNDGVRYFTVDGIEVFNPEKGQILIRVEGDKAVKVVF